MINRKVKILEPEKNEDFLFWKKLKEGDLSGLEGLYRKFSNDLFKYGMTILPDSDLVKDCIQELFLDLWKYRERLNDTDKVKIYLCRSLSNKIFREIQLQKRRRDHNSSEILASLYPTEGHKFPEDNSDEVNQKLEMAIYDLPERQKEIIHHLFFCKLSSEEISIKMGIAVQSVYTLTWKAIRKLKISLNA